MRSNTLRAVKVDFWMDMIVQTYIRAAYVQCQEKSEKVPKNNYQEQLEEEGLQGIKVTK